VVYSPADAVEIAKNNPEKNVIFLGVGFETSAPGTAAATMTAQQEGVSNFSVYTMLKTCEPVLRTLCEQKDFEVKGFLCPGHVATIIGAKGFEFLSKDYGIPGVVSGFEGEDILLSIYQLLRQIKDGKAKIINEYTRGVTYEGNVEAQIIMSEEFDTYDAVWRGLGKIEKSGLRLNKGNAPVIPLPEKDTPTGCRCGDVICGRLSPKECPMFGKVCTPEDPVGPCMVSSEGACSASYKYDYT
jgi:hydrogenase expression/formation protein HypD